VFRRLTAPVALALLAVYVIWGSTYLAIKVALRDFPPFSLSALRFLAAGLAVWVVLRLRGAPRPTARQWRHGAIVGILLPAAGTGSVVWAERTVASGIAAVVIATVPLWAACFAGLFGTWPSRRQGLGLVIGFGGVALLCLRGELRATPGGAALLVGAASVWAFGSVLSRRLDLPKGPMAPAIQMIAAGATTGALALLYGERPAWPPTAMPLLSLAYLAVFGSIVAYSAYAYLLARTPPAVATSYAYVNPVVALLLGAADGERLGATTIAAIPVILLGLSLVLTGTQKLNAKAQRRNGEQGTP
jgi:drug/metabolite transporter (DMT)-like permease